MSKEYLEALEELRDFRYGKDKLLVCQTEMYSTIKKALQRLEAIDNANSGEALECLERITAYFLNKTKEIDFQDLRDIEQALIKAQENENKIDNLEYEKKMLIKESVRDLKIVENQHKVLEIIKEKPIQSRFVIMYLKTTVNPTYEDYRTVVKEKDLLIEEEFNMLKEMFKDE